MTTENISEREHGKGHVTATTVPCKLKQRDRYGVPQNVFLLSPFSATKVASVDRPIRRTVINLNIKMCAFH